MVQQKKGRKSSSKVCPDAEADLDHHLPLQAILLADSFTTKFLPITLERPKVLLPLVNVPMIEYSLAWLESSGVKEVFVFCCAHSKQVINYLETSNSQWFKCANMSVRIIELQNAMGQGDALRLIYERDLIHGDFVLITGDTVTNMSLKEALDEHRGRRKRDRNAVMTMVVKKAQPSAIEAHKLQLGTGELFMAIDPVSKQLLYYEDEAGIVTRTGAVSVDKFWMTGNTSVSLHNDMQDCCIDICAPEVLSLFADNFDYQHLRSHLVKGVLVDDVMGYKIYTHGIHSSYAAKVQNFRSYDAISKDIIQISTQPLLSDVQSIGNSVMGIARQGIDNASDIRQSCSAEIDPCTIIGNGTTIGNHCRISKSVIGEGCKIGSNVSVEDSYIWNNVTIEDGCKLIHAIVCDGVVIKAGAVLEPGVILSYKVVIKEKFVVPAYSKVSTYEQPTVQDSEEELQYADTSASGLSTEASEVGAGYIWSVCEGDREEEWKHSVAPIPEDTLAKILQATNDDVDLPHSDKDTPGETSNESKGDNSDDHIDDEFQKEVEETFQRAVHENIKEEHVILEVQSLRLSYNMTTADCAGAIFYSMMKLAIETPHFSDSELRRNVSQAINTWKNLLMRYLPTIDEEIEVILKLEEMCLESAKEFAPLFSQILYILYSQDVIQENAILSWESEKQGADKADREFVEQSEPFIQWLKNAEEEDSEDED